MPATEIDLTIEKGATYRKRFQWLDGDDVAVQLESGGYTAAMQIKARIGATESIVTLAGPVQGDADGSISMGDDGYVDLLIPHAITTAITARSGVYDLELTDQSGNRTRLLKGTVTFDDEVTI